MIQLQFNVGVEFGSGDSAGDPDSGNRILVLSCRFAKFCVRKWVSSMKYTIISGTGRAGTTLLVKILTRVGLDTGFSPDEEVDEVSRAGLEQVITESERPTNRIIKSPWMALTLDSELAKGEFAIEHAIICIRDLSSAAESRRRVQAAKGGGEEVVGGLWMTQNPKKQDNVLAKIFYRLVYTLTAHDVPMTFLHFPRFAEDVEYAVRKLSPVFPEVERKDWLEAHAAEARPDWIRVRSRRRARS